MNFYPFILSSSFSLKFIDWTLLFRNVIEHEIEIKSRLIDSKHWIFQELEYILVFDILNLEYEFGWSKIKCFFRWVFFVVKDLLLPSKHKNIPTLTTTNNVPVYLYTGQHRIPVIHTIHFLHPPTQTFMIPAGYSGNASLSEDK